ncbi:hypothetical protein [uncultured Methanomethylovorans sp.]|uniref:hypothetical protein n=1 Tax=uncultured Methanomethylovorans sp. TaxID=183759 RepID=UPI0026172782|nr:hypothetical protein [uncultured Methanomethylovorans sp.]
MASDEIRIKEIFQKVKWLDDNRWSQNDETPMNFSSDDLKNSEKVLTHFLCYICDRGMPYSQIWQKGAFVFSEIIHAYTFKKDIRNLLDPNDSNSFFDGKKNKFISKTKVTKNNILVRNSDNKENERVEFISRYYPADFKSIMQTLTVLEKFDRNIIKFISYILDTKLNDKLLIKRIAYAFYLLAYYNIGKQAKINLKDYNSLFNEVQTSAQDVCELLSSNEKFEAGFKDFIKSYRIFEQKRVWCALREYQKSKEHHSYIIGGFEEINRDDLIPVWDLLDKKELELPGDVWNNNKKFRDCLFGDLDCVKTKSELSLESSGFNSSYFMRKLCDNFKEDNDNAYPEMFDVTFDFIPRMCEQEMCDFCIFNEDNKIEDLCTRDPSKYCPVLLISCCYINKCNPEKCVVLANSDSVSKML